MLSDIHFCFRVLIVAGCFASVAQATSLVSTRDGQVFPAQWPEVTAGEHPFGHAEFRPSPERPLGYRGCQNGWFPGATPPLEFRDGTVRDVAIAIYDESGQTQTAQKVMTTTDRAAVNVRFKTVLPGWSQSQPLPVLGTDGRLRVFLLCHPWWVVCVDGKTGRTLWKDELTPFHAQGLAPAEAERRAEMLTAVWAAGHAVPALLGHSNRGFADIKNGRNRNDYPQLYSQLESALLAIHKRLSTLEPELAPHVTRILGHIRKGYPSDRSLTPALGRAFDEKYPQIIRTPGFWSYTGFGIPSPVSDGEHIYVTHGQGQVACYTPEGQRIWARLVLPERYKRLNSTSQRMLCSPALIGNRLIFAPAPDQNGPIVALDASTGETA